MGQRTDRDGIHARGRDVGHRVQGDAAEASSRVCPFAMATQASEAVSGLMLSSRTQSGSDGSTSANCSTVSTSTSIARSGYARRAARTMSVRFAPVTSPPRREVVVLEHDPVVEAHAVIPGAAATDGVLLQESVPRGGLAGVENHRVRGGDGID